MPTVTLLAKAYNNSQLNQLDQKLKSMLEGLKTEIKACGVDSRRWIQVQVTGEDENVALHYLADTVGVCQTALETMSKYSTVTGRIIELEEKRNELTVDVGIHSPKTIDATVPLQYLQAQLCDGRKVPFRRIIDLFGFCEDLPITIKISSMNRTEASMTAELAEKQQRLYENWVMSLLDRLLILGASDDEIKLALKRTGCTRDVVSIEPLGVFEHAVVCKLGTDAAGLIPILGRNLGEAAFTVFNPRKILHFLESKFPVSISR